MLGTGGNKTGLRSRNRYSLPMAVVTCNLLLGGGGADPAKNGNAAFQRNHARCNLGPAFELLLKLYSWFAFSPSFNTQMSVIALVLAPVAFFEFLSALKSAGSRMS